MSAEGVEFNPAAGFVRMGKKEIPLTRLQYEVFEHIVFGERPFSHDDFDKVYFDLKGDRGKEFNSTYMITIVHRLQKQLKKNFGKEIAERIVSIPQAGYVWIDTPKESDIQPGKFWFHPEKKYLYFGAEYVHLPARMLSLAQGLYENFCRPKTDTFLLAYIDRAGFDLVVKQKQKLSTLQKIKNEFRRHLEGKAVLKFGNDQLALNPALFAGCKPWLFDN